MEAERKEKTMSFIREERNLEWYWRRDGWTGVEEVSRASLSRGFERGEIVLADMLVSNEQTIGQL